MDTEILDVVDWLNENYNQDSENYNIFFGSKPEVVRYNDHIAVSPWACGAIVCFYDIMYFICEDDGQWWIHNDKEAVQTGFSIGWAKSFCEAIERLKEYVDKNGEPVYFSGLPEKIICHYRLGKSDD